MALKKIITEKYEAEQIDVFEAGSEIVEPLRNYLFNEDFRRVYGSNLREGSHGFVIPSINASLSIQIDFDSVGRERGGSKIYDFSDPSRFSSEIRITFSYLEDTPEEDLKIIRKVIKNAGLEQLAQSQG